MSHETPPPKRFTRGGLQWTRLADDGSLYHFAPTGPFQVDGIWYRDHAENMPLMAMIAPEASGPGARMDYSNPPTDDELWLWVHKDVKPRQSPGW